MFLEEDTVHRPRTWREKKRRLEKEENGKNWHKGDKKQMSAPLIIDPVADTMTKEIKLVYKNFKHVTGIRAVVQSAKIICLERKKIIFMYFIKSEQNKLSYHKTENITKPYKQGSTRH